MKLKITCFLFFVLYQASSLAVIFGPDDRKDFFEINDPKIRQIALSTAALILKENIVTLADGRYQLKGPNLIKEYQLCEDENFSDESQIANCSASLISPNRILTAAHCVDLTNPNGFYSMDKYFIVFNYLRYSSTQREFIIEKNDLYEIKKNVFYDLNIQKGIDLAVFELDRPTDKTSLTINTDSSYQVGTPLFMFGHPMGISLKLSDNSVITEIQPSQNSFRHQLDAFSVNSGSAIFNADTNEIIGVLVRGTGGNFTSQGQQCLEWHRGNENKDWMEGNFLNLLKNIK